MSWQEKDETQSEIFVKMFPGYSQQGVKIEHPENYIFHKSPRIPLLQCLEGLVFPRTWLQGTMLLLQSTANKPQLLVAKKH